MRRHKPIDRAERFFDLLAALSSRSTQIHHDEIDREIIHGLARVCSDLQLDRSIIAQYLPEKEGFFITSEWSRDGLPPGPAPMLPAAQVVPWICGQVAAGETVAVRSPEALPSSAKVDRAFMLSDAGPKATVVFPVIVGARLIAGITFEDFHGERAWDPSLVTKLKLATGIFGNALERKRAAAEANRLKDEIQSVGRLALGGETAAAIAHELSHPLGAILANAQAAKRLLEARRPNLTELGEALDDVITAERRAAAYIAQVRSLFRRAELSTEKFAIDDLFDSVIALARSNLSRRCIELREETESDLPTVRGDRVGLEQVMLNLVTNAADALSRVNRSDRLIEMRAWLRDADRVSIAVTDHGEGIEEHLMSKIFQPLFTTKPRGTGMGLVIVRSIIEAHGEQITVKSERGAGATFEFTLPVA